MVLERSTIETAFETVAAGLSAGDELWCHVAAESSDFVRLNHAKIRQAGAVDQMVIELRLVRGRRQATSRATLGPAAEQMLAELQTMFGELEALVDLVPEDPYLLLDDHPRRSDGVDTESESESSPADAHAAVNTIIDAAGDLDLVGIWASGWIERGVLSSRGHRLWHRATTWSFDWSVYLASGPYQDKAVTSQRGGTTWQPSEVIAAIDEARGLLPILAREPKVLEPGAYRTWLAPKAVAELVGMFNWGGFSTRAQRTNTSVLQELVDGRQSLSPLLTLAHDPAAGGSPLFTSNGHELPGRVDLISQGALVGSLTGARSAAEYGVPINADGEAASDLVCAAGDLPDAAVCSRLGTGVHVADCWYTNWSDRNRARATGMTRFHSFWVENGEIVAPLSVMRFDDSLIDGFGANLEALGERIEIAPATGTYGSRRLGHTATPGAMLSEWRYPL